MEVVCALLVLLFSRIDSFVPPTKSNEDANSSLESHVLQLEKTLMDVQTKLQVQEQNHAAVLTSVLAKLTSTTDELDTLKNNHQSLQKKFDELAHKQTTQENEISRLRTYLNSSEINLQSVIDDLTKALNLHVGFLNANMSNIKDDIENIEQNLTQATLNSVKLKSTVNAFETRFTLLEDEVINLYGNISATRLEVNNMASSLDQRKSVKSGDNTTLSGKLSNGEESFLVRLSSDIHPPKNSLITFQEVIQNLGNSYNRTTGKFTAPVSGIYLFHVSAMATVRVQVDIVMDDDLLATAWGQSGDPDIDTQGSNMAMVHMRQGQRVWARFMRGGKYLRSGGHTQFTGALLRTD